jgi:anti-anti-sigma factor
MTITKTTTGDAAVLTLAGRLDTTTAPDLQVELIPAIAESKKIILDFSAVNYVSSAGLRVLLAGQKEAKKRSVTLKLTGVIDEVMEVFNMTGFSDILTIE